ncbi:cinnamoyl-CoA reductase 1 [Neltuma alba]|uniref:cinnamoyl-CoA reductase 1 n=1 Tax=Neltuma alba TaxID=207710 RepID=UPI0010A406D1|nr:cinnamoyl-CoA reductase 1-like [Prosopis alba]
MSKPLNLTEKYGASGSPCLTPLERVDSFPVAPLQGNCMVSKILAEEAALKFAEENNIDLVAMNPAMGLFPSLLIDTGAQTFPNNTLGWVNVKDAANAHVKVFETPSASGRYCLVGSAAHSSDVVKILRELHPTLQLPEKCADDKPFMPKFQVSNEKAKALGIEFNPLDVTLKDQGDSGKLEGEEICQLLTFVTSL